MNQNPPLAQLQTPEFQALLDGCIHCGLCLTACPTYNVFHTEMDGPRGRIALMRAASQERIELTNSGFETHIDRCLGCRACETACPSGVHYGHLFETTRAAIAGQRRATGEMGRIEKTLRTLALRHLLPHRARLRGLARLTRLYQTLGGPQILRRLTFLPVGLRSAEAIVPPLQTNFADYREPARAIGARRGAVAFLHGCVQDAFLGAVNAATVRVLQRNGFDVYFPRAQTCCGAAGLHIGEDDISRDLARRNIDAFAQTPAGTDDQFVEYDAILNNAGGCGATLKEYGHLLRDDPAYAERAVAFSGKVCDITEFLAENLHVPPQGSVDARVTYLDSCHLRHAQRVASQPRFLLQEIPGLSLVELAQPDQCCGSAGVYNLMQPQIAGEILKAKLADISQTGAEIVAVSNTGCHMQMLAGARQAGLNIEVLHVVQLLDRAYGA